MKHNIILVAALTAVFCILFQSCQTTGSSGSPSGIIADRLDAMPDDAARAVQAAGALITGRSPASGVTVSARARSGIARGVTMGSGFGMTGSSLYEYESLPSGSDRQIRTILDFENPIGQRCQVQIRMTYQVRGRNIDIHTGSAEAYYNKTPESVCFILPAAEMKQILKTLPDRFDTLYQSIAARAVTPDDKGLANRPMDWGMMVFFMDRVSPPAKVRVSLSASLYGFGGYAKASRYLDYNGWRVGFAAGRFTLMEKNRKEKLFLKAIFSQGEEGGFLKKNIVTGLYALNH